MDHFGKSGRQQFSVHFAHRLENAALGDTAQIDVGRWVPASFDRVEFDCARHAPALRALQSQCGVGLPDRLGKLGGEPMSPVPDALRSRARPSSSWLLWRAGVRSEYAFAAGTRSQLIRCRLC